MSDVVQVVNSPQEIVNAARRLREAALKKPFTLDTALGLLEKWAVALQGRDLDDVPGIPFLRLWLRRGTLGPILERELGSQSIEGGWLAEGMARLKTFPLGVVGHWPAGNIEIQPLLSLSCALLGGNSNLVRVPSGLVDVTRRLLAKLVAVDSEGYLIGRIALVSFDHSREELHQAMAQHVDGAMIWGGAEAVSHIRALPFPHWAHVAVFGPRLSVAAMDAAVWDDPSERSSWCQRIARDVWQFDQQACSSPQALFLERGSDGSDVNEFIAELKRAFEEENRVHPRREIQPAQTAAVCLARATWLMGGQNRQAWFPKSPDWTILFGQGIEIPKPTQGRTLNVLLADNLVEVVSRFDGAVQTLGLAIGNPEREELLAQTAGSRGVDRIVKLGSMHVFGSPWDGVDLIRPMVRVVRHVPSQNLQTVEK
jgi:hypothetical protein